MVSNAGFDVGSVPPSVLSYSAFVISLAIFIAHTLFAVSSPFLQIVLCSYLFTSAEFSISLSTLWCGSQSCSFLDFLDFLYSKDLFLAFSSRIWFQKSMYHLGGHFLHICHGCSSFLDPGHTFGPAPSPILMIVLHLFSF